MGRAHPTDRRIPFGRPGAGVSGYVGHGCPLRGVGDDGEGDRRALAVIRTAAD